MADESTELSLKKVKEISGKDAEELTKLNASKQNIGRICDLRSCKRLERLDLSQNSLTSLKGIRYCCNLKWLNVSSNRLDSLTDIKGLFELVVLNAGHNSLTSTEGLKGMTKLKALILNDNHIRSIKETESLTNLNALVLSHNKLESISVSSLVWLTKLSLSHNRLKEVPSIKNNKKLKELRLNDNKIKRVPEEIRLTTWLVLIDLGNNRIKNLSHVEPLGRLAYLKNLNLRGNPFCSKDEYKIKIIEAVPSLDILDGSKLDYLEKYNKKGTNTRLSKDNQGSDEIHETETSEEEQSAYKKTELKIKSEGKLLDVSGVKTVSLKDKADIRKRKKHKTGEKEKDFKVEDCPELKSTCGEQERKKVSKKKKNRLHANSEDENDYNSSKVPDEFVCEKIENVVNQSLNENTDSIILKKENEAETDLHLKIQKRKKRKPNLEATNGCGNIDVKEKESRAHELDGEPPLKQKKKEAKNSKSKSEKGESSLNNPRSAVLAIKTYKKRRNKRETEKMSDVNTVLTSFGVSDIGTGSESAW